MRARINARKVSETEWTAAVSLEGLGLPARWRPYGLIVGGGESLPEALRDLAGMMEALAETLPKDRLGPLPAAQLKWLQERGVLKEENPTSERTEMLLYVPEHWDNRAQSCVNGEIFEFVEGTTEECFEAVALILADLSPGNPKPYTLLRGPLARASNELRQRLSERVAAIENERAERRKAEAGRAGGTECQGRRGAGSSTLRETQGKV